MNDELDKLLQSLPPMFGRAEVKRLLPGVISPGYLANLDSRGEGPPSVLIGKRKRAYVREPFIEWLRERSKTPKLAGCCANGTK
jgi:hypothetical protein